MSRRSRHQTMLTLVSGASSRVASNAYDHVVHELEELGRVQMVSPLRRRHLLQSMHALRALESALREVVKAAGLPPKNNLGELLTQIENLPQTNPSKLSPRDRVNFHNGIRPYRNRLMHTADFYPSGAQECERRLSEIEACMALVVK